MVELVELKDDRTMGSLSLSTRAANPVKAQLFGYSSLNRPSCESLGIADIEESP